nr:exocyst complex component sec15 [Quercus suber]
MGEGFDFVEAATLPLGLKSDASPLKRLLCLLTAKGSPLGEQRVLRAGNGDILRASAIRGACKAFGARGACTGRGLGSSQTMGSVRHSHDAENGTEGLWRRGEVGCSVETALMQVCWNFEAGQRTTRKEWCSERWWRWRERRVTELGRDKNKIEEARKRAKSAVRHGTHTCSSFAALATCTGLAGLLRPEETFVPISLPRSAPSIRRTSITWATDGSRDMMPSTLALARRRCASSGTLHVDESPDHRQRSHIAYGKKLSSKLQLDCTHSPGNVIARYTPSSQKADDFLPNRKATSANISRLSGGHRTAHWKSGSLPEVGTIVTRHRFAQERKLLSHLEIVTAVEERVQCNNTSLSWLGKTIAGKHFSDNCRVFKSALSAAGDDQSSASRLLKPARFAIYNHTQVLCSILTSDCGVLECWLLGTSCLNISVCKCVGTMPGIIIGESNDDLTGAVQQIILSSSETDYLDQLIPLLKTAQTQTQVAPLLHALNHVSSNREAEIERICNTNHQEFIGSVNQLQSVREGTVSLTSEIMELSRSIETSTEKLAEQKKALVDSRGVRQNIDDTTQALKDCLEVLRLANQVHDLLGKKNHYAALRALDELQNVHLREVMRYKIAEMIEMSVPATQRLIADAVMTDLNTWLFRIREISEFIGEVAFYHTEMRRARQRERAEQDPYLGSFKLNSAIEMAADEPEEFDVLNNDEVQVDFSPLFECLHIYQALGQTDKFRADYAATRRRQKDLLIPQSIDLLDEETGPLSSFLEGVAGFAIVEKATMQRTENFRLQSDVDEMWDTLCQSAIGLITAALQKVDNDEKLLKIKGVLALFIQTMDSWGYSVASLDSLLLTLFEKYSSLLNKRFSDDFEEVG